MRHYRQTTSCWLITQALVFCLLLQGTGIAQALPLPPKKVFISQHELEARSATPPDAEASSSGAFLASFSGAARSSVEQASTAVKQWFATPWPGANLATDGSAPIRVAQAGGVLPLPPRMMSFVMAASGRGRAAPPTPPDFDTVSTGATPPAELLKIMEKAATEQIPLLTGLNLISIPEEPADTSPAAVFAAVTGEVAKVTAYDACDLSDPWKVYDPADPASSDLTLVDHKIGMWVLSNAVTELPSDGTLPATTTIQLCEGWNLIGFPTGEPRHPYAALSSIAGKWERIFGYDAFDPEDPWEYFDPAVPEWANDLTLMYPGRGYWVLATEAVALEINNQGPPPTVTIASPADLAVVTEPADIVGSVESDRLESWTLTYRPIADGDAVTLATSNAPVSNGTLATFDPTLLLNGLYEIELTATDFQGQQVSESIAVSVEGQMKIGHFTLSFVDLAIPVSGLDIEIIRTYDSRDKQQRDFGVGWNLDIRQGSYRNNRKPGEGWQFQTGFTPCDTLFESKSHLTVVRLSDQEIYRFALTLHDGDPTQGGCFAFARFDYVDGPLPGATLEILGNDQVFYENGSDRVIDVDSFEPYEPQDVRLTTRDGRIFELDLNVGVTLLEDLNGNKLSITPAGITHSSGKGIAFERDAEGRITRIVDPLDRASSYTYDTAGDLISFTDRAVATTRFSYDGDHRLLDIEDARGIKPIRNEYDADGRLVRHIDAFGKVIEFAHDLENRRELLTNRLGHSRLLEYDVRGNVIRETDELGQTTERLYDTRDQLISEVDPLGRTIHYSYTATNELATVTDPLGQTRRYTYNGRGQILTATDPRGAVTAWVYDDRGNLTQTVDALSNVTVRDYDTNGNLRSRTNASGDVWTFGYDDFGNRVSEVDPLGHTSISAYDELGNHLTLTRKRTLADGSTQTLATFFTYDVMGRRTATTAPEGYTNSVAYDQLGKISRSTDAMGRETTMTYDLAGRLESTSGPDGRLESQAYDAEGRLIKLIDSSGLTTTYEYDPLGRLITTTFPDGTSIANVYDAADQLIATTDARGHTTSFNYDAVGRRIKTIDALGHETNFSYDANGNQNAVIDPLGNTTSFAFDSRNRAYSTTHPDGTSASVAYDTLGRLIAMTDQSGLTTDFTYDQLSRLTQVKDAYDQTTTYSYDELGNLIATTDANGNTAQFEYDSAGRQTARILPSGARETSTYNADGTLAGHTDFKGDTYVFNYDTNNNLVRRTYPDGSEVTFTYTPNGRRATATDSRGTTSYTYDNRGRLTEKTDPNGFKLNYAYDAGGNRVSMTATVGASVWTTTYTYDALDRITATTDSHGNVTELGYDPNGRISSLSYPNDVVTSYTYDAVNQLTHLHSESSAGDVLQSYFFTMGPTGNRSRIDEVGDISRFYEYDLLHRLTEDRVSDPTGTVTYQRNYTYDPVGNRLSQTINNSEGLAVVNSAYDAADRLLNAGTTTYAWDLNGNMVRRNEEQFTWGFEDRLTSVTVDGGTRVEKAYDVDGNRVRKSITEPGEETTVINYLVDTTGPVSHVIAEVANGQVLVSYQRAGEQLIGLHRPVTDDRRYFHNDGLGSVRVLSDETGVVTDRYTYSAFGELLEQAGTDPQPYRFAGEAFDPETRLYYNRARWLAVDSGRFTAVDRFPGIETEPASQHSYLYAAANPVNITDPSGKIDDSLLGAIFVVALLGALVYLATEALTPRISPIPVRVTPIYAENSPWDSDTVNNELKKARSQLLRADPGGIFLEWSRPNQEFLGPSINHVKGVDAPLRRLHRTYKVKESIMLYLVSTVRDYKGDHAAGIVPLPPLAPKDCDRDPFTLRDGFMAWSSRRKTNNMAHELAHAAGCLDDVELHDVNYNKSVKHRLMYSFVPRHHNLHQTDPFAGHSGYYLTPDERKWLRANALHIR